jgi:hypothetical protein
MVPNPGQGLQSETGSPTITPGDLTPLLVTFTSQYGCH